jgi:hypothetical protein
MMIEHWHWHHMAVSLFSCLSGYLLSAVPSLAILIFIASPTQERIKINQKVEKLAEQRKINQKKQLGTSVTSHC